MRLCSLAIGLILFAAIFGGAGAARADAVNYPWCADSGNNCSFSTYEQCRADVSGIGGFCMQNPQYQPSTGSSSSQVRKRNRPY